MKTYSANHLGKREVWADDEWLCTCGTADNAAAVARAMNTQAQQDAAAADKIAQDKERNK